MAGGTAVSQPRQESSGGWRTAGLRGHGAHSAERRCGRERGRKLMERDDKWVRCIIEWDRGRLAGAKVSIQKYVSFRMPKSGPNMSSGVHNGVFQSREQL